MSHDLHRPGAILASLLALGCAGRAEFRKGQELFAAGEHRQAYYRFWEAATRRPCVEYLDTLQRTGAVIAGAERRAGRMAEARGDLEEALARFTLALEYHPGWVDAAEDYSHTWQRLEDRASRLQPRHGAAGGAAAALWQAALGGAAELEAVAGEIDRDLAAVVEAEESGLLASLRRRTWEEPLPAETGPLDELCLGWLRLGEALSGRAAEEEAALFAREGLAGFAMGEGRMRRTYLETLGEVTAALARIERAKQGAAHHARGQELERRGELGAAVEAYSHAIAEHPEHIEAQGARSRARLRLAQELYDQGVLRTRKGDLLGSVEALDRALEAAPGHAAAAGLRASLGQDLASSLTLECRRLEGAGLLGGALARAFLAWSERPGDRTLLAAIERLESRLAARARASPRVVPGRRDPRERRFRRDLWAVGDEDVAEFEMVVERLAQGEAVPGRAALAQADGADPVPGRIEIADLDFAFHQSAGAHGGEEARYASGLELRARECVADLERRAARARHDLDGARLRAAGAGPYTSERAQEELELAGRELAQVEAVLQAARGAEPEVTWETHRFPTREVTTRAEAAALLRSSSSSWWVTASIVERDHIVEGDLARSVPPDRPPGLSRGEALRRLAPLLGREIRAELDRRHLERDNSFYHQGVRQVEAHAFDLATESLVLFLYSRRARGAGPADDPVVRDAVRRVQGLTGCDLAAAWALHARLAPRR